VYRFLVILCISFLFIVPARSQQTVGEANDVEQIETEEAEANTQAEVPPEFELQSELESGLEPELESKPEPEPEPEVIDETGLDEQGFTDDDDDFRPTEDIPADQSIAFPTDI